MKIVVIGAGLSGLECGYILAREGNEVIVLEQAPQIGGCLQTFCRKGYIFDTGFHYVGGLDEGEHLWKIFRYLGLLSLPWKRLDDECFDEVTIGNKHYPFASGHKLFAEHMIEQFPQQHKAVKQYTHLLKQVGDNIFDGGTLRNELFTKSAYEYLCKTVNDPLLRDVLAGTSMKMDLDATSLPLYTFAQINDSYLRGAYRLCGGGHLITQNLTNSIHQFGGQIFTSSQVKALHEKEGRITSIAVSSPEVGSFQIYNPDWVISSLHPATTLALVGNSPYIRRIYRSRINRLCNTRGIFTANLILRPNSIPYQNKNLFIYCKGKSPWQNTNTKVDQVMVHFVVPPDGNYATQIDLLTPMSWNLICNSNTICSNDDYNELKQQWLKACLALAEERLPGLTTAVSEAYTSTPYTYQRYLGSPEGNAFGVRKDYRDTMGTIVNSRTPLSNLMLTGQNLTLHGVLGVSMTSLTTTQQILNKPIFS